MCNIQTENEMWLVSCTDSGLIHIKNKIDVKKSFDIALFKNDYRYLLEQWLVFPEIFLTPDSKYVIVTYGIGYVYFILLSEKRLVKTFQLFPDINYDNNSFKSAERCCYYDERTQVDFSSTGRYAAIRVRGDYDPQDGDGRDVIFTPVYFRSIFIIDLLCLEVCFHEDYSDVYYRNKDDNRNLASIAFSPNDNYIAMGALGNIVKIFHIISGECLGKFSSLVWIADPLNIRDCPLIAFLDERNFVYVNRDNNIIKVSLQKNGQFVQSGIINTNVDTYDKWSSWSYIEKIESNGNEIICYIYDMLNYYTYNIKFQMCFDDINKKTEL